MESLRETVRASDDNRELFAVRNPLRSNPEYSNTSATPWKHSQGHMLNHAVAS
jgi:hypothetical protein